MISLTQKAIKPDGLIKLIKVLIRHTCSYPVLLPEKSQSSLGKSNIYDDIRFMAMLQSHIAGALTKQGPIRMIRVPRMDKSYIID